MSQAGGEWVAESAWALHAPMGPGGVFLHGGGVFQPEMGRCRCGKLVNTRFWVVSAGTRDETVEPFVCQECYPTMRALWAIRGEETWRE